MLDTRFPGVLLRDEGVEMGFLMPPAGYSVNPNFQAYASLQSSLVSEILVGHLGFHVCCCLICFVIVSPICSFSSRPHHPAFSVTFSSWLSAFQKLVEFSHSFDHSLYCWCKPFLFHYITLMRFEGGRGEIVYVQSTALSPFVLWYVLEGDKDCEGRKCSHFMIYSPVQLSLLLLRIIFITERKNKERINYSDLLSLSSVRCRKLLPET